MFKTIASNSYYDIAVDAAKNRIHITIKGFWETKDLVPHYISHINEAVSLARPSFSVLVNLTRMVPPTHEVTGLHHEVQKLFLERGLARSAEVVNDPLLVGATNGYSAPPEITRRVFYDPGFAEAWLDSFAD